MFLEHLVHSSPAEKLFLFTFKQSKEIVAKRKYYINNVCVLRGSIISNLVP